MGMCSIGWLTVRDIIITFDTKAFELKSSRNKKAAVCQFRIEVIHRSSRVKTTIAAAAATRTTELYTKMNLPIVSFLVASLALASTAAAASISGKNNTFYLQNAGATYKAD